MSIKSAGYTFFFTNEIISKIYENIIKVDPFICISNYPINNSIDKIIIKSNNIDEIEKWTESRKNNLQFYLRSVFISPKYLFGVLVNSFDICYVVLSNKENNDSINKLSSKYIKIYYKPEIQIIRIPVSSNILIN